MMCKNNDLFVKKFVLDHSREEEGGQRGDLKSFFFNFCLVIVSHFLMFFKNYFFERFWDLPGGLPGFLLGSFWVPSGTTFRLIFGLSWFSLSTGN